MSLQALRPLGMAIRNRCVLLLLLVCIFIIVNVYRKIFGILINWHIQARGKPKLIIENMDYINRTLNINTNVKNELLTFGTFKDSCDYTSLFYRVDLEEEIRESVLGVNMNICFIPK